MPDQNKLSGLKFKIPQKNNKEEFAISNELNTVNIPFCFYRYAYKVNDRKNETVDMARHLMNISNVTLKPFNKEGFLYLYYENKLETDQFDYSYGAEYRVNVYSSEREDYSSVLYSKIHPESGNETYEFKWTIQLPKPFINLNENDIIWIAFSEVRWSKDFRERIMNDFESVKKRFQCLDVTKFIEMCKTPTKRVKGYSDIYARWSRDQNATTSYNNMIYAFKKDGGLNPYVFVTVAATLFADDMCDSVSRLNNDFKIYIDNIVSGVDPQTGAKCPDKNAYQALIMSASVLYPILLNMSDPKKSSNEDSESPLNIVQVEKFTTLFDYDNRNRKKEQIWTLQDETHMFFNSLCFKYALLEYLDNKHGNILKGKERIVGYYERIKHDPYITDLNLYSKDNYNRINENDHYNPIKENIVVKFSCQHFFYENTSEEQKYQALVPSTVRYVDINHDFDMIKLLLNTITDESKLFEEKPKDVSITDIYNLTAELLDQDEESDEEIVVGIEAQELINNAIMAITTVDSILWYFTNFVATTNHYKQLEKQINTYQTLIKELGVKKTTLSESISERLEAIHRKYEQSLALAAKDVAQQKNNIGRANAQKNTSSIRKTKKKNNRIARNQEAYNKSSESMNSEILKQKGELRAIKHDNKLVKRIGIHLNDNSVKKANTVIKLDAYEQGSFGGVRKIAQSPVWVNLIYRLNLANLLLAIYTTYSEKNQGTEKIIINSAGLAIALTEYIAVVGDNYFEKNPDLWKKLVEKLKFKNEKMSFGVRLGIGSSVAQVGLNLYFAHTQFTKGNSNSGEMYVVSAASMGLAAYVMSLSAAATADTALAISTALPYVGGALLAISLVTGIVAAFYEFDEFKDFLASSVFAKGGKWFGSKTVDTATFNTSYKMGIELYDRTSKLTKKDFNGLGFNNANLGNFLTMFDIIRSLFTPIRCVFHGSGNRAKGGEHPLVQYENFRLWIKYGGGILRDEKLEYEARIYPNGTGGQNSKYTTISLSPDKQVTSDETLIRFSVNQNDIDRIADKQSNGRRACLVILVRIRSGQRGAFENTYNQFYPSPQNDEPVYFGFKTLLVQPFNNYYYFSVNLQPKPLSQILAQKN